MYGKKQSAYLCWPAQDNCAGRDHGWGAWMMSPVASSSIANIVRKFAAKTPDNTAIKFANRNLSWGDLHERSNRTAASLQAAGVASQQRVAFLAKLS